MICMAGFHTGFFLGEGKKRSRKVTHANTNKSHLVMCITIEGPDLKEVNFNHIFKDQNHRIAS